MDEFLAVLARAAGQSSMTFGADARIEVPVGPRSLLEIRRVGRHSVELVSTIDYPVDLEDPKLLAALLHTNHLGDGTGAGRIGIEEDELILSERIDIRDMAEADIGPRFDAFLARLAFWNGEDGEAFLSRPRGGQEAAAWITI